MPTLARCGPSRCLSVILLGIAQDPRLPEGLDTYIVTVWTVLVGAGLCVGRVNRGVSW